MYSLSTMCGMQVFLPEQVGLMEGRQAMCAAVLKWHHDAGERLRAKR